MLKWLANANQVVLRDLVDLTWYEINEIDLAIQDSWRRGDAVVNPLVISLATKGVASLFFNWQQSFPKAYAAWSKKGLRLVIGRQDVRDLKTGLDKFSYHWFICDEQDRLVARVVPKTGIRDLFTLPPEKLTASGADLIPEVSELYRYFIALDSPVSKGRRWFSGPDLDFPGGRDNLAVGFDKVEITGNRAIVAAYDALATSKLRCLVITREKQYIVYKEGCAHGDLYLIDGNGDENVRLLENPIHSLDCYFASVIAG